MVFLFVGELIGRFHPVLVHLPIGILLIACVFQWLAVREKFTGLLNAVPLLLLLGGICAVFSCISGYLLSKQTDYNESLISRHQWLGISTAAASFGVYYLNYIKASARYLRWSGIVLFSLITITGHLGGSLTHGEDYLSEVWNSGDSKPVKLPAIPNIQQAVAYKDVVMPIFEARCYTCHGATKQKGKLRLDSQTAIEKGGEDGAVLVAGKPEQTEFIKRLMLSMEAKKHMPPKNNAQLSGEEIALLHWWVEQGADFSKKIKDIPQPPKLQAVLVALQEGKTGMIASKISELPEQSVAAADQSAIQALQKKGVVVVPVAQGSNYLAVNFISALAAHDSLARLLPPLQKQIVSLKMDGVKLSDAGISILAACTQLRRLQLNNTGINDAQLAKLSTLTSLQSINLVGTSVTPRGLAALSTLTNLKNIYIYKSAITQADRDYLAKLKGITVDTGNYAVPTLPSDTTLVTKPQ
jgi:uncharacterized membrane protein/mono/diheme cytochrome c family protein